MAWNIKGAHPEFSDLVAAALQTGTLHIAIVTFSAQPSPMKNALEGVLGMELAKRIPIRGGDHSWKYEGVGVSAQRMGNRRTLHMAHDIRC